MLLVEHPAANLTPEEMTSVGADVARVSKRRTLAVIVLSATPISVAAFVDRMLILNAATGDLTEEKRGLLGRLFGRSNAVPELQLGHTVSISSLESRRMRPAARR